jgi:XisI protein
MDTLENYRNTIKTLLTGYSKMTATKAGADDRLAFDELRDQYLWFRSGWDDKKRVCHIILYLCIQDGKVWVEEDLTDLCVVDDLLAAGVSQADIVLGFHHPSKRSLTEFASA